MTADVELLPLPDKLVEDLIDYADRECKTRPSRLAIEHAIQRYARANVERHAEALRAEVRERDASLAWWGRFASGAVNSRKEAEARAERLAEALRGVLPYIQHTGGCMGNLDPALPVCGCGMLAFREQLRALLRDQEEGK